MERKANGETLPGKEIMSSKETPRAKEIEMMSGQETLPSADPEAEIIERLLDGFRASKAMFAAVALGVFESLHADPATSRELSARLDLPEHALARLLGACTALGLLSIQDGRYHNQPAATRFLRRESSETMTGYIQYSDRVLFPLWSHLEDALREGSHRWEQEFGGKRVLFDRFFSTEQEKRTFLSGMHGGGLLSSPAAVAAFDLSRFQTMADLGGGTGHLVIEACKRYPNLRGWVFDLPAVGPVTAEYIAAAGLEGRIKFAAGDFFTDPFPAADLCAMGRILHDWSDEKVRLLLEKIFLHLGDGGALLICEKLLSEKRDGPATAYLQSLNMLVCTEGRERTPGEYEALVKSAGFKTFAYRRTGRPLDVMLATK